MTARNSSDIVTTEATRYQVALVRGTKVIHVYGYTSQKSKEGLVALVAFAADDAINLLTNDELKEMDSFTLQYTRKNGLQIASNTFIRFTGVTGREAAAADNYNPR